MCVPVGNTTVYDPVKAWYWTDDKSLPQSTMTQSTEAYMCHQASMRQCGIFIFVFIGKLFWTIDKKTLNFWWLTLIPALTMYEQII